MDRWLLFQKSLWSRKRYLMLILTQCQGQHSKHYPRMKCGMKWNVVVHHHPATNDRKIVCWKGEWCVGRSSEDFRGRWMFRWGRECAGTIGIHFLVCEFEPIINSGICQRFSPWLRNRSGSSSTLYHSVVGRQELFHTSSSGRLIFKWMLANLLFFWTWMA